MATVKEFQAAISKVPSLLVKDSDNITCMVWKPLEVGSLKINMDGSWRRAFRRGFGGGLVRDSKDDWIQGFIASFRHTRIMRAKVWAIFEGLKLGQTLPAKKIILETNSVEDLEIITSKVQISAELE